MPTPSTTSPAALWSAYHASRADADRNALVEFYLPLVQRPARRMHPRLPREVQLDDLIQWGTMGLMDAVKAFDPGRDLKFPTFAAFRIKGRIVDGLRDTAARKRSALTFIKLLDAVEQAIQNETGRTPTPDECADRLGYTPKQYRNRFRHRQTFNESLEAPIRESENETAPQSVMLPASGRDPGEVATTKIIASEIIGWVLKHRRLTDALIIRLYYLDSMTMNEISEVFDVSESSISQHHKRLIALLRDRFSDAA